MIRRLLAMVTPDLVGLNGCCCYRRPFIYSSTHLLTHSPLIHHSPTHSRPLAHSLPHITHSSTQTTHLSTHPFVCAACVYCWHDVSVVLVVGSLVVWSRSSKEHTRFGNSLNVSWWWRKPPWCFQTKRFFLDVWIWYCTWKLCSSEHSNTPCFQHTQGAHSHFTLALHPPSLGFCEL